MNENMKYLLVCLHSVLYVRIKTLYDLMFDFYFFGLKENKNVGPFKVHKAAFSPDIALILSTVIINISTPIIFYCRLAINVTP